MCSFTLATCKCTCTLPPPPPPSRYAVQLSSSSPCSDPVQLTESGYFHRVTVFPVGRHTHVHVHTHTHTHSTHSLYHTQKSGCFVDVYSNPSHPPSVQVCTLTYSPNLSSQSKMQLYTAQGESFGGEIVAKCYFASLCHSPSLLLFTSTPLLFPL